MAGKVFFSVTMSLDGFIAPEERRDDPDVQRWMAQWTELQQSPSTSSATASSSDGIEPALDQARETSDRDVRIAGGAATILEYLNTGLTDEFTIALSPVLLGSGIRLFEDVDAGRVALEQVRAEPTHRVTHLTYAARER